MTRSLLWLVIVGVCGGFGVPTHAVGAQAVRRREFTVVDSVSGAAVQLAEVHVTGPHATGSSPMTFITDTLGHFVATTTDGERLLISIRRIGFAPTEIQLVPTDRDTSFVIAVSPTAAVLGPMVTQADQTTPRLEVAGFYERRHERPGTFLDSAAIANKKPYDLMSVLRPYLHGCTMIYVDGMRLVPLRDLKLEDVLAIEIYSSNLQAPPQFANPVESMGRCGSIVIWRRF